MWVTVDPSTCAPNPETQALAADLVRSVMELRPRFTTALRVAQAEEEGRPPAGDDDVDDEFDDDFDAIKGMGRLFCEARFRWCFVCFVCCVVCCVVCCLVLWCAVCCVV